MLLQLSPGRALESPPALTTGYDGWLLNITVPRSSFVPGPSTDSAAVVILRPQMNFLMRPSFGLEIPTHGSAAAWEKGERSAKLITHRRTLLVLDGLEPFQNAPGSQEGRLREPSLQALLRELAAFGRAVSNSNARTCLTQRRGFVGSARSPYVIRSIVPSSCFRH